MFGFNFSLDDRCVTFGSSRAGGGPICHDLYGESHARRDACGVAHRRMSCSPFPHVCGLIGDFFCSS